MIDPGVEILPRSPPLMGGVLLGPPMLDELLLLADAASEAPLEVAHMSNIDVPPTEEDEDAVVSPMSVLLLSRSFGLVCCWV